MLHVMQEACPDAAWAGTMDSAVGTFFKGRTSGQATSMHAPCSVQEGKNRQVRRMFEALGYEVMKLKRESIEDLTLEGLKKGEYRTLTIHEVKRLINKAKNGEK